MAGVRYRSRIPKILAQQRKRVEQANQRTAARVRAAADAAVPRLSGDTARTLDTQPLGDGESYEVTVGFPGQFVEFGTRHQGAQPFLTPAAEGQRAQHRKAIKDALQP